MFWNSTLTLAEPSDLHTYDLFELDLTAGAVEKTLRFLGE